MEIKLEYSLWLRAHSAGCAAQAWSSDHPKPASLYSLAYFAVYLREKEEKKRKRKRDSGSTVI